MPSSDSAPARDSNNTDTAAVLRSPGNTATDPAQGQTCREATCFQAEPALRPGMNPEPSPVTERRIASLLSKKAAPANDHYSWRTCRRGAPFGPYMRVCGNRVSWSGGLDDYSFHTLKNEARRCRAEFRPDTKEWEFPDADRLRRFLANEKVGKAQKGLTVIRDSSPPRFAVWVSACGTLAIGQPLAKSCAAVCVPGFWERTSGRDGVRSSYIVQTGDAPKFAALLTEPWALGAPVPVNVRVGASVAVVQMDPRNDPRHLLVAGILRLAGCGAQPVVVTLAKWVDAEPRIRAAGIPLEFGTNGGVVAPEQDCTRVPRWLQRVGGQTLNAHQRAAVEYLGRVGLGALLADEMGLGKTVSAIAFCESIACSRVVVVAPLSALEHWRTEISRWSAGGAVFEVRSGTINQIPTNTRWVLINYEQLIHRRGDRLERVRNVISESAYTVAAWSPDQLVIDEGHRAKNPKAGRSRGVAAIARNSKRVLLMTGTPVRNHPREVLSLLALLSPGALDELTRMAEEWKTVGSSTLVDIARSRLSTCMLRRTKAEVLKELPPVTTRCMQVDFEDSDETQALLREAYEKLYEMAGVDESKPLVRLTLFREALRLFGMAKAASPTVEAYVVQRHARGERTLVFAWHVDVVARFSARLEARGLRVACITGETSPGDRNAAVAAFQRGDCDAFVGTVGAAGESISLTRANSAAMLELTWVPAELEQASARGHRIGQNSSEYTVVYFYANTPADLVLLECIQRKLGYVGAILADESYVRVEEIVSSVVARLRNQNES